MVRRLRPMLALSALVLAAGCGDSDEPAPASSAPTTVPAPVGGLLATIGTNRLYAPNRELGLGVQNVGDAPVLVHEVQLDSNLFAPVAATERDVLLEPGGRPLVLPVPYGEVRCDGGDPTLDAVLVVDDGRELRVPAVEDYDGAIDRLHARECAAADVRERVDITFGDRWTREGVAITGELALEQRHAGEPVAIDDAAGNVIFTLLFEDRSPVLGVSDAEPTASVPVTISADRCDPHALAEVKRPFVFMSWVAVGDGTPVPVELELQGAVRAELEELLATCRP